MAAGDPQSCSNEPGSTSSGEEWNCMLFKLGRKKIYITLSLIQKICCQNCDMMTRMPPTRQRGILYCTSSLINLTTMLYNSRLRSAMLNFLSKVHFTCVGEKKKNISLHKDHKLQPENWSHDTIFLKNGSGIFNINQISLLDEL